MSWITGSWTLNMTHLLCARGCKLTVLSCEFDLILFTFVMHKTEKSKRLIELAGQMIFRIHISSCIIYLSSFKATFITFIYQAMDFTLDRIYILRKGFGCYEDYAYRRWRCKRPHRSFCPLHLSRVTVHVEGIGNATANKSGWPFCIFNDDMSFKFLQVLISWEWISMKFPNSPKKIVLICGLSIKQSFKHMYTLGMHICRNLSPRKLAARDQ